MENLPDKEDFGDMTNLDVNHAWLQFGGKTLEEAFNHYATNAFFYREDLMWMGNKAFVFYFPVALRYLQSESAIGDSDTVSSTVGMLEFRLQEDANGIQEAFDQIRLLCDYVIGHYELFDVDPKIYGDVKSRYIALKGLTD